jgi:ABC-type amino acid transport substrate-binding protein
MVSTSRSVDERIARWLEEEASVELPDRVFQSTFTRTRSLPQEGRGRMRRLRVVPRRLPLLAAAALILTGATIIVGAYLVREPQPDLLTRVEASGVARIGVRPDHPQARGAGALDGFDIDVATELGRRLGVTAEIQPVEPTGLLDADEALALDILLPSMITSAIDPSRFARSVPYYWWPHYLVVDVASGRTDLDDLAGQAICAVEGDVGEAWLRGEGDGAPIDGSAVVLRATDAECLAALADGSVAGIVTARMGPADLAARPTLAVLAGPPAEPRVIVAALALQPGSLMVEVDGAISGMLDDGTLTRLSKNRFGGYDLTRSPAP